MIRLEDIDPGNWRLGLKVTEEQTTYAADRAAVGLVLDALQDVRQNICHHNIIAAVTHSVLYFPVRDDISDQQA